MGSEMCIRDSPVHLRGHREDPPGAHLRQARRGQPHRRREPRSGGARHLRSRPAGPGTDPPHRVQDHGSRGVSPRRSRCGAYSPTGGTSSKPEKTCCTYRWPVSGQSIRTHHSSGCGRADVPLRTSPATAYAAPELRPAKTVSYTHLTLPTTSRRCRSRWSPYH